MRSERQWGGGGERSRRALQATQGLWLLLQNGELLWSSEQKREVIRLELPKSETWGVGVGGEGSSDFLFYFPSLPFLINYQTQSAGSLFLTSIPLLIYTITVTIQDLIITGSVSWHNS